MDANTGVVTVANGTLLNREAAASHDITVRATSADGSTADTVFTISVIDLDEFDVTPSSDTHAAANAVNENAANGTTVGITVSASDADATTNGVTYSLTDSAGGRFAVDANSGVVTVANGMLLNREAAASHTITVRSTSADGSTADTVFAISVNDADEFDVSAPADAQGAANTVAENAANGTVVGITASASDADAATNAVTYSLTDDAGGRFSMDANTGVVTVADGTLLNREAAAAHNVTVRATSADGSMADTVFTINVTDIDEFDVGAVSDSHGAANSVAENAAIGTTVGITAAASDADVTTNAVTYSLDDNAGGRFAIHATSGVVTVAAALDFETATSHDIAVRATSADGSFSTQVLTIQVTDVNESGVGAISDVDAAANLVLENATDGATVGLTAFSADPDSTDTVTYSLDDDAGGRFAIDANSGVVTVADGSLLNREAAASHNITVRATSTDGSTADTVFTIAVTDVNEFDVTAPTDANTAANSVDENATNGTVIDIKASAWDADATTNGVTYLLTDSAGGRFAIDAHSGVVTVADGTLLNHDVAASHNITVRATSADGSTADTVFTIVVNGANNDSPIITSNGGGATAAVSRSENAAVVTTVTATDADLPTQTLTYTIVGGADAGRFAIDSSTGALLFLSAPDFETPSDADADNVYEVTVQVSDDSGGADSQAISITVTPVNEAPSITTNMGAVVAEGSSGNVLTTAMLNAGDADDAGSGLTYTIVSVTANGTLRNNGLALGLNSTFTQADLEAGRITYDHDGSETTSDSFGLRLADGGEDNVVPATGTFNIGITPVNDAPTSISLSANQVLENAAPGTLIGTAAATDVDAGETFGYELTDDAAGRFAIDASTGDLTVADGSRLDFETASSYAVTIRVTDSGGLTHTETFIISVRDFNESPTAQGESYTTLQFGSLTISSPAGVLANDQDADGDALAAVLVSDVAHGTLSLHADGAFVYVPDATFSGTDSFTYMASDGSLTSTAITVTITVEPVAPATPPSSGGNSEPATEEPLEPEPVEEPVDETPPEAEAPAAEQPAPPAAPPAAAPVAGGDPTVAVPPKSATAEVAQALEEVASVATVEAIEDGEDAATRFVRNALRGGSYSTSLNGALTFVPLKPFVGAVANAPLSLFMPNEEWTATTKEDALVSTEEIVLGTTTVVSTALSVGYVVWLVRGGSLVASLAASLPAWTSFDPLPILQSFEDQNAPEKKDEESLCDLVS